MPRRGSRYHAAMARVLRIWLRPSSRTPSRPVETAIAVTGVGLEGDHAHGGKRQVTLISREAWEDALRDLDRGDLDPRWRRANILVEGIPLGPLIGKRIRVGAVELEVKGETRPCQLMDDARLGLRDALVPAHRGGVFAEIAVGGEIAVGDPVVVMEPARA